MDDRCVAREAKRPRTSPLNQSPQKPGATHAQLHHDVESNLECQPLALLPTRLTGTRAQLYSKPTLLQPLAGQLPCLLDIPSDLLQRVVKYLNYRALPAFRQCSKQCRDLVDAGSEGWILKPAECQAIRESCMLTRLPNLTYLWFEGWDFASPVEDAALDDFLRRQRPTLGNMREIRFNRCLGGLKLYPTVLLCEACTTQLTILSLPQLCAGEGALGVETACRALTVLQGLRDLHLEQWSHTDTSISYVARLSSLRKLSAGSFRYMSSAGYTALGAGLSSCLHSLWCFHVTGTAATVAGLTGLTSMRFLRAELGDTYLDPDLSFLAALPNLETIGWWHRQKIPSSALRPLWDLAEAQHALQAQMNTSTPSCTPRPAFKHSQSRGIPSSGTALSAHSAWSPEPPSSTCHSLCSTPHPASTPGNAPASPRGLAELSLCLDLDDTMMQLLTRFPRLGLLQVMSITVSPTHRGCLPSLTTLVLGLLETLPTEEAELLEPSWALLNDGVLPAVAQAQQQQMLPMQAEHVGSAGVAVAGAHAVWAAESGSQAAGQGAHRDAGDQPAVTLGGLFPNVQNLLVFNVAGSSLAQLQSCRQLVRLALHVEELCDEQLLHLPPIPSLKALQLESCKQLSEVGMRHVAHVVSPTKLLLVSCECIGDACLQVLAEHMPSLQHLALYQLNKVSEVGLLHLPRLSALKKLDLIKLDGLTPHALSTICTTTPSLLDLLCSECTGVQAHHAAQAEAAGCMPAAAAAGCSSGQGGGGLPGDLSVEYERCAQVIPSLIDEVSMW